MQTTHEKRRIIIDCASAKISQHTHCEKSLEADFYILSFKFNFLILNQAILKIPAEDSENQYNNLQMDPCGWHTFSQNRKSTSQEKDLGKISK